MLSIAQKIRISPKRTLLLAIALVFTFTIFTPVAYADLNSEKKSIYTESTFYDPNALGCNADGSTTTVNPNIYVIGDSYSRDARDIGGLQTQLTEKGYTPTFNALGGRSITDGGNLRDGPSQPAITALDADKATIAAAGTILVILGTNPDNYDVQIPKFMDKLKVINSTARVFWVNTAHNDPTAVKRIAPTNTAIQKYSAKYSYSVIDWYTLYSKNPSYAKDLHPSDEGFKGLAKLIITSVGNPPATGTTGLSEINGFKIPATKGKTGAEEAANTEGKLISDGEDMSFSKSLKAIPADKRQPYVDYYITMRWTAYSWLWTHPKNAEFATVDEAQSKWLSEKPRLVIVTNPRTKKSIIAAALESGPPGRVGVDREGGQAPKQGWVDPQVGTPPNYTGIVSGFPPIAMKALGAKTGYPGEDGDILEYGWAPDQNATPGPVNYTPGAASGGTSNPTITAPTAAATNNGKGFTVVESKSTLDEWGNAKSAYSYLLAKGLTPVQAAGIIGNVHQESNWQADQANERAWPKGGYGIIQWTGGRRLAIVKAMEKAGIGDLYQEKYSGGKLPKEKAGILLGFQLDYMWNELTTNPAYKPTYKKLLATKDVTEATRLILFDYETPWETPNPQIVAEEMGRRLPFAKEALKKFAGVSASTGDTAGSNAACEAGGSNNGTALGWDLTGANAMTYYSQEDKKWKNTKYGQCTIGEGGCGPTSAAMIIATLAKDPQVTPVVTAAELEKLGAAPGCGTDWDQWKALMKSHGLQLTNIGQDLSKASAAIKSGGLVLASFGYEQPGGGPSLFTTGRHLMVLRKTTDDGNSFYIADPVDLNRFSNKTVYTKEKLLSRSDQKSGALNSMWAVTK